MTIKIDRTHPLTQADLDTFLRHHRGSWRISEQDSRAIEITEFDLNSLILMDCIEPGQDCVPCDEKLHRIQELGHIRLDAQIAITILEDTTALDWLNNRDIDYLDFPGTIQEAVTGNQTKGITVLAKRSDGTWYAILDDNFFHRWPKQYSACLPAPSPQ